MRRELGPLPPATAEPAPELPLLGLELSDEAEADERDGDSGGVCDESSEEPDDCVVARLLLLSVAVAEWGAPT